MSGSITQLKERLLKTFPVMTDVGPISLCDGSKKESFSLECLLRAIKVEQKAGLLSRVNYHFPKGVSISATEALAYAEVLTRVLAHSQVFVVQDIDGDRSYFLRMDTLLQGRYERDNIASFLDDVTQDVDTVLDYFRGHLVCSRPASPSPISSKNADSYAMSA